MKLRNKIIAGVFGAVALAAVPASIALVTTSCGSGDGSSNGSSNDSSNGSGSGDSNSQGNQSGNKPGSNNGHHQGPNTGSGGADIVGLKKPIPGVIPNDQWKEGMTFIKNGFTYKVIPNPNYFAPEYGFPTSQPTMALEVIGADTGVVHLDRIADNNSTGVVDYLDNSGKGEVALPVTKIAANLLPSAVIGAPTDPKTIIIPDSVSEIGSNAFSSIANNISKIILGNSLRIIGSSAFSNLKCSAPIVFPQVLTTIGTSAFENTEFSGELVIPPKVTIISQNAFNGCTGFTSVKFPNGLKTIQSGAFQSCISLTGRLYIPESVTSIGNQAFWNNSAYEAQSVYVSQTCMNSINEKQQTANLIFKPISQRPAGDVPPASVFTPPFVEPGQDIQALQPIPGLIQNAKWKIGDTFEKNGWTYQVVRNPSYKVPAFSQIQDQPELGLKITTAIKGVVSLDNIADDNQTGIVNYSIDRSKGPVALPVVEIGDNIFGVSGNASEALKIGAGTPQEIIIPDSVTRVGNYFLFNMANPVTKFQLGKRLNTIGSYAFNSMKGVQNGITLALPEAFTTMGTAAFANTPFEGQLALPSKLKAIASSAFSNCKFTTIALNEGLQTIGSSAFQGCKQLGGTLTIPKSVTSIGNQAFYNTGYPVQKVMISSSCQVNNSTQDPNLVWTKG